MKFSGWDTVFSLLFGNLLNFQNGFVVQTDVFGDGDMGSQLGIIPKDNDIAFENIGFSYEKDEFKMENLSFDIDEKTMTALVGESGSGKTTITNLLLRFYDVFFIVNSSD